MELQPALSGPRQRNADDVDDFNIDELDLDDFLINDEGSPKEIEDKSTFRNPIFAIKDFFFPGTKIQSQQQQQQQQQQQNRSANQFNQSPNQHQYQNQQQGHFPLTNGYRYNTDHIPNDYVKPELVHDVSSPDFYDSTSYSSPQISLNGLISDTSNYLQIKQEPDYSTLTTKKRKMDNLQNSTSAESIDDLAPPEHILTDSSMSPEDILKMLNQSFIQQSEYGQKKKIDMKRQQKMEKLIEQSQGLDIEEIEKKMKKREDHASVERKRRDNINECISEFARIVPDISEGTKTNKGLILRKALIYMENLLNSNSQLDLQLKITLEQLSISQKVNEQLNFQLMESHRRIAELEARKNHIEGVDKEKEFVSTFLAMDIGPQSEEIEHKTKISLDTSRNFL